MAATAAEIARLRRMVKEPTEATYDDETMAEYIERYPHMDERGEEPYTFDTSTSPPTQDANDDWIPTYDLNAAAADIWEEKAANISDEFDFQADGGKYTRSQVYEQYMANARRFSSKRAPKTMTLKKHPEEIRATEQNWIGNLPESD
jgi:hypothetical protein